MTTMYLIIIVVLIIYVIFLHIQMVRKNVFIESSFKRLNGVEKEFKLEELVKFREEIKKLNYYSSFFSEKLFEEKPLNYLFENVDNLKTFIHYTKDENDAISILTRGFRFVDSFYKTALPITNDKLDLIVKHNNRKYYGNYIIVICISNNVISRYSSELKKSGISNFNIENIITEEPISRNENSDPVFVLPNKFVKGYINHVTADIINNPDFNPDYCSPEFDKNIEKLKNNTRQTSNSIFPLV
jgi:hypothetical protein